jgi:spermidine/putrescine transport system ATP-binding protein
MRGDGPIGETRGRDVRLEAVSIVYPNGFAAVHPTDLTVAAGEFFSILGPSGCGKTTLLRAVSGFVEPTAGRVLIGGADMRGVGPNARPTAMIFQSLALFPLMPVWENVAFGLEARGVGRRARRERAMALLDLVALSEQADKKPSELSGGQRQRVAVARALAVEPAVLLLDEPLSALDLKLRQHMRAELRAIQKKTGVTFVYITHDQGEALTMSDRVAVMNAGRIEQVGPPDDVYAKPATAFAASFLGETNVFAGPVTGVGDGLAEIATRFGPMRGRLGGSLLAGDAAMLFVRPERMRLGAEHCDGGAVAAARVVRRDLEGPYVNLFLRAEAASGPQEIAVHLTNDGAAAAGPGETVATGFAAADAVVLPQGPLAATGRDMLDRA